MPNGSSKRKRESMDQAVSHHVPQPPGADFAHYLQQTGEGDISLAEALAQHNAGGHGPHDPTTNGQDVTDTASAALHYSMTVPAPTEATFLAQNPADNGERQSEPNFDLETPTSAHQGTANFADYTIDSLKDTPTAQQPSQTPQQQTSATPGESSPPGINKPAVGSDEWHKVRRDNHKEVERRRRETINEGINEIAKIVPGCEKNKGSILARAVQFIQQLKDNESQNIEKWTLEKMLTEQAISELSSTCDRLKREVKEWRCCGKRLDFVPNADDRASAEKDERLD